MGLYQVKSCIIDTVNGDSDLSQWEVSRFMMIDLVCPNDDLIPHRQVSVLGNRRFSEESALGPLMSQYLPVINRQMPTPIDTVSDVFHDWGLGQYPTKQQAEWDAPQPQQVKYIRAVSM